MVVARPATASMACDRMQPCMLAHNPRSGQQSASLNVLAIMKLAASLAALLVRRGVLDLMVSDRSRFVRTHEAPTDQESSTAVYRGS
jgi:hypothetical protein